MKRAGEESAHPSYLELDRHSVGLLADAATAAHLTECARCQAYLAGFQPVADVPRWVAQAAQNEPPKCAASSVSGPRVRRHWTWTAGGMAVAAAVCLALLWPRAREPAYDGVKGAPGIAVYVQRHGVAALWDGTPLAAGDRIRLEVMPEEFDHVSVFSLPASEQTPLPLYTGRVPRGRPSILPKAWELDAAPGPENIAVMLSRSEISPEAARSLLRARDPREVWLVVLSLPKQSMPK